MTFIFGTGGLAREVDWLTQELFRCGEQDLRTQWFVAENTSPLVGTLVNGAQVISEEDFFSRFADDAVTAIVAVGKPRLRAEIVGRLRAQTLRVKFPSLVHPGVRFDRRAGKVRVGQGCIIGSGAVITTDVTLGEFVVVNNCASVSHDATIGDFATVSPGARVCGSVALGRRVFLGASATVIERLTVCDDALIGAGATVVRDIEEAGTYAGLPARRIR